MILPRIITKLVGWAVAVFYDVERTGPPLADGPVLVVANHPNALVDPLVIFRTGGRPTRPLAKAPLFRQAVAGTFLRGLGGLPVYRKEDAPDRMHMNEGTFDAAVAALGAGEAVQIYPEGRSHSEPAMAPLRTGAARIALLAEERSGWSLGLRVQPVGLTYSRKHLFRGRAVAAWGEPLEVGAWRARYEADPREAARALTEEIRARMEAVTLNFEGEGDRELVEVAERLWAREKGLVGWRERDPMARRLPRLKAFEAGLRWLSVEDPERLATLRRQVRRYLRLLTLVGAREGDVPPRYPLGSVLRYSLGQALMLILVLPAAVAGLVLWWAPYMATRHLTPLFRPKLDQVATYKLGTAILAFPLWLALLGLGGFLVRGAAGAAAVLVGAPLLGLAAIAWRERGSRVREDVAVFRRAARSRRGTDRLREARRALAAAFDEVMRDMEPAGGREASEG